MTESTSIPVVVAGSINVDLSIRVPRVPQSGETLLATSNVTRRPGGKGANQAIAASRFGAQVHFIGCVGDDQDGRHSVESLSHAGIDTTGVHTVSVPTGVAFVMVLPAGDNFIVVSPGANHSLSPELLVQSLDAYERAIVLMQGETPAESVSALASHATERPNLRVVLNLAPWRELGPKTLATCDPIIVNQVEASQMTGEAVDTVDDGVRVAKTIGQLARSCVITMGEKGACFFDGDQGGHIAAPAVGKVIDTTGAGDGFVGALAASLSRSEPLNKAVADGVVAGASAITFEGAQLPGD
jgi:ribokinase